MTKLVKKKTKKKTLRPKPVAELRDMRSEEVKVGDMIAFTTEARYLRVGVVERINLPGNGRTYKPLYIGVISRYRRGETGISTTIRGNNADPSDNILKLDIAPIPGVTPHQRLDSFMD